MPLMRGAMATFMPLPSVWLEIPAALPVAAATARSMMLPPVTLELVPITPTAPLP